MPGPDTLTPTACAHCGRPATDPVPGEGAAKGLVFCCGGCAAVHGLAAAVSKVPARPESVPAGPSETVFDVEGVTCAACVTRVEGALARLPGVSESSLNLASRRVRIRHDASVPVETLAAVIARAGYRAHAPGRDPRALRRAEERRALWRVSLAGFVMMQIMMFSVPSYMGADEGTMSWDIERLMDLASLVLTVPVLLFSSGPIFRAAITGLRTRQPGMDLPVALGITVAFLASVHGTFSASPVYYDSITMLVFFILCGRYFESKALAGTVDAADGLAQLLPRRAWRLHDDGERQETDPAALAPGDRIWIPAGEAAPADALVKEGRSEFDESLLTGETYPVPKSVGDRVLAGSVNLASPVEAEVACAPGAATVDLIRAQMDRAASAKPRWALLADRVATHFISIVIVLAALGAAAWMIIDPSRALEVAVATLVVTCPCALSLATPVAITACVNALSRAGVMVTSGRAIEALASATHVVFDKTGTLTTGRMRLRECVPLGALGRDECLALAAALESALSHPVAHALVAARPAGIAVPAATDLRPVGGAGVEATVDGRVVRVGSPGFGAELAGSAFPLPIDDDEPMAVLAEKGAWLAAFRFADLARPEAPAVMEALRRRGLALVLLSGDRAPVVDRVGEALGVADRVSGASPEDKARHVEALAAKGAVVAMVGDGINDAPVLARAQVSLALAGGSALAQSQADLVVANPSLEAVVVALDLARRTRRIIRQNVGWSIAYNLVMLPLALAGLLTPWIAAVGMSVSSLIVVGNALRLVRRPPVAPDAAPPLRAA